ncbi:MAG: hypothetical protein FWG92_00725 [Leptospirales bacterium]|nr:hypothetical protein [Leptospirales bacterium]
MGETDFSNIGQDAKSSMNKIVSFSSQTMLAKIVNKLTDYTDILSESKLSTIINYNYNLTGDQIKTVIKFLVNSRALSCIYMIAQKGSKDFAHEYVSNVFSNPEHHEHSQSYLSLRNTMELRLTQQTQQFNINMGISNIGKSMPLTTLRSHVKMHDKAVETFSVVPPKVQHGYIAASLHDAYVTLIPRIDFWNDKTYMKFFFSDKTMEDKNMLLTLRQEKKSILKINKDLNDLLNGFDNYKYDMAMLREETSLEDNTRNIIADDSSYDETLALKLERKFPTSLVNLSNDPTMQTPFGKQYGAKINSIISNICSEAAKQKLDMDAATSLLCDMFNRFCDDKSSITIEGHGEFIIQIVDFILFIDTDVKNFSEVFLYRNRKESFSKFFQLNSSAIDAFFSVIFGIYFQERFKPVLKFIKTDDMMTFACAFIVKRIYIMFGDAIALFGFFLIKAVASAGKVQIGRS